ncbi:MAG: hypothetical protein AAGA64_07385 [Bacteroidota bacterium]
MSPPPSYSPEDYFDIINELNGNGVIPILVAGQAVNLWAKRFIQWDTQNGKLSPKLTTFAPFTSDDMDILRGDKLENYLSLQSLRSKEIPEPFGKAFSPDLATLWFEDSQKRKLKIQIMGSVLGLDYFSANPPLIAMKDQKRGISLKVLDPISLLQCKTANLFEIPNKRDKDYKHLQILIRCIPAYIDEAYKASKNARGILKLINRIEDYSDSKYAKKLAINHKIDWSCLLPWEQLEQAAKSSESIANFLNIEAPRWHKRLQDNSNKRTPGIRPY